MEDSIFYRPMLEISEELDAISIPVFEDEVPESLTLSLYETENIPSLFALCHVSQVTAQPQIIKALELAYSHLRRSKLKQSAELAPPTLKKPRIHEVIILLKSLFKEAKIFHLGTSLVFRLFFERLPSSPALSLPDSLYDLVVL